MNRLEPIYTEKTQCQDCYKCVRRCPVKAIKIKEDSATVVSDLCIVCGRCVNVCPVEAKKIREDLDKAKQLLRKKKIVIASLAPSYVTEFEGINPSRIIRALKEIGFYGVSETSLGAEIVSSKTVQLMREGEENFYISSACPTVVELIRKYHARYSRFISPLLSPVLAHCKMLRQIYGDDIGIVFFSPCIAKKKEADNHPLLLDVSLTFRDLRNWIEQMQIDLFDSSLSVDESFIPRRAGEGALYPIEGGMIDGMKEFPDSSGIRFMSFSGIEGIQSALADLNPSGVKGKLFVEMLACEGGCINGPRTFNREGTINKRIQVVDYAPRGSGKDFDQVTIGEEFPPEPVVKKTYGEEEIREALRAVGKLNKRDELNCGGCGYDSCRSFAEALIEGKSEPRMCVSYMRKLALNKANALIKAMPSGVVIVDEELKIIDCNEKFAEIIGQDVMTVFEAFPGLEGASLKKIIPFHGIFSNMLQSGTDEVSDQKIKLHDKIIQVSIFPIERDRIVGGIIRDITLPAVEKEQIINKTQEVIRKNLTTVQQIAYLLGENAAETEVILNSIIESFTPSPIDKRID